MQYIEKVKQNDPGVVGGTWYLPHFATSQAKLRVVYDGAKKFQGTLINDHILPGPDLLQSLFNVITYFRLGEHAITADLRECFFQAQIPEE